MRHPIVSRRPGALGGTVVFHGTRVPVQTLLDYLEAGNRSTIFSQGFRPDLPARRALHGLDRRQDLGAPREQVIAFLEEAKDWVIEAAS